MHNFNTLAVSGAPGSFSEEAGRLYLQREGVDADIHFAIDMAGVLTAVEAGEAECGIFPVVNNRGGLVQDAFRAMGEHRFRFLGELWFEVFQCLMALPGVKKDDITQIATHPQAIAQCERYIRQDFPDAKIIEWEDTAKAAKDLHEGVLPADTAVIAPSRAAQLYDLALLDRGIQDAHPNLTTFIIVTSMNV